MGPFKPILLLTIYKHLSTLKTKFLGFAVGIRNIEQRRHLYLQFFWVRNVLYPVTGHKSLYLCQQFFCLFFSSSRTHQSHHLDGCQAMAELFFYFWFLGLTIFITTIALKKIIFIIIISMITIIIIIVIIPHIYLLSCNRPTRDKLQRRRVIFYCFSTHFLCFKTVRDIP